MKTDTKMTSRSISILVNKYNKLEGKSACGFVGQRAIKKMQKRMTQN